MQTTRTNFALTETQQTRLLACRAAWEEGEDEERFVRLRQRDEDADTLRAFHRLLDEANFAAGKDLTYAQCGQLLTLARALAPNPNLDARLLRRPGEPGALNRDLRDLLFGGAAPALRLRAFLVRRHAGGQTALQLLCAAFPDEWPLVTQTALRALELAPEQMRSALDIARERYDLPAEPRRPEAEHGIPNNDPVLRLLADVVIYEAVRDLLESADYLEVHRLLTQGLADRPRRSRRPLPFYSSPAPLPIPPFAVREEVPEYEITPDSLSPAPDISGLLTRDILTSIERYVAAQGFTYPVLTVRDYYIALQTKPFCVVSGVTGTGKTRLTSLFAEALTGDAATQYRLLPVRPDWADSTPLLGYVNLLALNAQGRGQFVSTPFLDFLRRASEVQNAYRAYFLCLDEMNLARVEHYLAEILSAMETPTRELLLPDGRALRLPANLFLTGTLNLDEATYALSRKALDRANTISFDAVCLRDAGEAIQALAPTETITAEVRQAAFLQARVLTAATARARLQEIGADFVARVVNTLAEANEILQPHSLHFAYRVRDEVLRYCANSFDRDGSGLLVPESPDDRKKNLQTALDLQLLQKVLPRFNGGREQMETPLRELLRWTDAMGFARSSRKLSRLISRLQRDGFVAFDET